jgi:hypothetical protein
MMLLWIGLFAMASMTAADTWTYAAGLLAAAAVLPLAMASAAAQASGRASRRYHARRAPVTVVWQRDGE